MGQARRLGHERIVRVGRPPRPAPTSTCAAARPGRTTSCWRCSWPAWPRCRGDLLISERPSAERTLRQSAEVLWLSFLARRDLRRAAAFLWITPLRAAMSMRFCASRASSCGVLRALGGRGGGALGARLQLAAHGLVALGALDGLAVALDLALDVCHWGPARLLGIEPGERYPPASDSRHIRGHRYRCGLPMDLSRLRNLSIVAHVDHGKSTLADRLLELCGAVDPRDMRAQYLDSMDIERERGITIKLQSVRLDYRDHVINLIDTPGHVDFGYEVSRSLAACEGVILLVDAAQGIEAQTLANCYLALENDLEIVACLNKLDLPAADPDRCAAEIEQVLGHPRPRTSCGSAPRPATACPSCSTPSSSTSRRRSATPPRRCRP